MSAQNNERAQQRLASGKASESWTVSAAVVVSSDAGEAAYHMFDVRELSPEGAVFTGPLLLEIGEEFAVELSQGDAAPARARARVVSLASNDVPGMVVAFSELSESDRRLIETWTAGAAKP